MMPEGFIRIKLIQVELSDDIKPTGEHVETMVAINIKERVDSPGEFSFEINFFN